MNWRCVAECTPEGEICGGPGMPTIPCCGGLVCKDEFLGDADRLCVTPHRQFVSVINSSLVLNSTASEEDAFLP